MNTDYVRHQCHNSSPEIAAFQIVDGLWMNDKNELFKRFQNGRTTHVVSTRGTIITGIISNILREDGSNNNWVVTISGHGQIFVKTF